MLISEEKRKRLQALSTPGGIIAALAIDQRKSLRRMMADAAGVGPDLVADLQVEEFKAEVVEALTPHASAVLLDPEYGGPAMRARAPGCGLLVAYEMDGYENPRPYKMLALMPHLSVRRLRDLGADGIKILLTYTPHEEPAANDRKHALIERIGAECEALDMPFFLEPVGYDAGGADLKGFAFAQRKPEIVLRSMEEFSKAIYKVDILKVEFPVNAQFVEGSRVFCGQKAYGMAEALSFYRHADAIAARPYIYLSAGVSSDVFLESLRLAGEAGARYSGVLCGRATWQDGAALYARQGRPALAQWLATEGRQKMEFLNAALQTARPWHEFSARA